ncbi:universal stress protein [Desulfovermiculus halophilus]|jgi:nucleotide-binding universal stress UspA family protein|uniref:universal stress protein n=1 Tax=Desulfovermiculus halophilus TaxID=339722 RepID=UPI000688D4DB|nr:universal stress protein [Desulfovermiculus halophilus]
MSWLQKKCVVVPIDFSDDSFQAIEVAREFVEQGADLHLVHITRPWSEHEIGGSWGQQTEEERLHSLKQTLRDKVQESGYNDAQIAVSIGSPPVEITTYAQEVGAELIVMPSHGRTGIKHLALGSVAERVVRMAKCPVLVLRTKEEPHTKKKLIAYD